MTIPSRNKPMSISPFEPQHALEVSKDHGNLAGSDVCRTRRR
jgi:hypothetical protein